MRDYTVYVNERVPLKNHGGEATLYLKHAHVFDD
jgi:hypothetical protein